MSLHDAANYRRHRQHDVYGRLRVFQAGQAIQLCKMFQDFTQKNVQLHGNIVYFCNLCNGATVL